MIKQTHRVHVATLKQTPAYRTPGYKIPEVECPLKRVWELFHLLEIHTYSCTVNNFQGFIIQGISIDMYQAHNIMCTLHIYSTCVGFITCFALFQVSHILLCSSHDNYNFMYIIMLRTYAIMYCMCMFTCTV